MKVTTREIFESAKTYITTAKNFKEQKSILEGYELIVEDAEKKPVVVARYNRSVHDPKTNNFKAVYEVHEAVIEVVEHTVVV